MKKTWLLMGMAIVLAIATTAGAQVTGKCIYGSYPTPCTSNSGCAGGVTNMPMPHSGNCSGTPNGAWNFTGTTYAGAGHTQGGVYPKLRFWEYNHFMTGNSGCQDMGGATTWYRSGRDLGCTGFDNMWYSVQTNWTGPGVDGAPSTTTGTRVMYEFSENGWYLIMSVAKAGPLLTLSNVRGGGGTNQNEIPVNTIPAPTSGAVTGTSGTFDLVDIVLPAEPPYYVDTGGPDLIDGAGIMYINQAAMPTSKDPTFYTGWASNPAAPDDNNPFVIPWGATTNVAIPTPTAPAVTYIVALVHYADTTVTGATNFLGSWTVSNAVAVGGGGPAVEWGSYTASLTSEGVLIEWTTLSEVDTLGFFVEKSEDVLGQSFRPIAGAMTEVRYPGFHYSYLDRDFVPGTQSMYRVVELTPEGENDRTPAFTFEVNESRSLSRTREARAGR